MTIEEDVINFFKGLFPKEKIILHTRIREDLGVDGDDSTELLNDLSKQFNVNLDCFHSKEYFSSEIGWNPLVMLWNLFFGNKLKSLTVKDIAQEIKIRLAIK